jgi:hypothetical protein
LWRPASSSPSRLRLRDNATSFHFGSLAMLPQ